MKYQLNNGFKIYTDLGTYVLLLRAEADEKSRTDN